MFRILAAATAAMMAVSLVIVSGTMAQPKPTADKPMDTKPMDKTDTKTDKSAQRVEGTIKSVSGRTLTLQDGTKLSIPASVTVPKAQLKPGAAIVAEYEEKAGQKVVTSVQIKG